MKTKSKPRLETGFLMSIHIKNKIHDKFCKAKDNQRKELLYQSSRQKYSCKPYKKSKEIYCKLYFQENKNNLVKVWNGINK